MGKSKGIHSARKLVKKRRKNRGAEKKPQKSHRKVLTSIADPLGGAPQAKGLVLEKSGIIAKSPNYGLRKCVRVKLFKNGRDLVAFVPADGCMNFIDENDEVIVEGLGRNGRRVGDRVGVQCKVIKTSGASLRGLYKGKKDWPKPRP
eukprot:TRINITY_DN11340_c0_g1_i1.p1 TRINITY_DN11340_c0_g1~~TRINITY_DN11340_c0_g1_i1.p1  ORF type:complete len:147 (-),score=10.30 TRINITY_DN11340_c0_g1_i1:107-547(-)